MSNFLIVDIDCPNKPTEMRRPVSAASWCRRTFAVCVSLICAIVTLDAYVPLLPFGGLWLIVYLITVSLVTVWFTFSALQRLLGGNKPLRHPRLRAFLDDFTRRPRRSQVRPPKDLEERISEFSRDIDAQFVKKWFGNLTDDETFREETRNLICDVTRRFLQVVVAVDGKKLLRGSLLVLLKHLKEYRRSVRRGERNGISTEESYRLSHAAGRSAKARDYFLHKLTEIFLRQFVSSELWTSLPCRVLVAVLSQKVVGYLLIYVSKPGFINYRLLSLLAAEEIEKELELERYSFISLSDGAVFQKENVDERQLKDEEKLTERPAVVEKEPVVTRPVKIYESTKSEKQETWRNSGDLECVSLGQDTLSNLLCWQDAPPQPKQSKVDAVNSIVKNKFGEMQDEAAGVVEGIFDLGMAGIRKGLRLTGLQDNEKKHQLPKWPRISSETNPPESPSFEGDLPLEKSPVPQISTDSEHVTSPEPEYEEAADFATTIAKLRSLLQQKSSESTSVSPMMASSTEGGEEEEEEETDGVMPSLYKFCAKTATGMFQNTINTLKTALPGTTGDQQQSFVAGGGGGVHWTYATDPSVRDGVIDRVRRHLAERREFCSVDTAYEAIDSLNADEDDERDIATEVQPPPFDDDPDDFDQQMPLAKALTDVCCELVADADDSLVKESVVRAFLLLLGGCVEDVLGEAAETAVRKAAGWVGELSSAEEHRQTLPMKTDKMVRLCIGERGGVFEKGFRLLLASFQSQRINENVFLQVLELTVRLIVVANSQLTPAYSA